MLIIGFECGLLTADSAVVTRGGAARCSMRRAKKRSRSSLFDCSLIWTCGDTGVGVSPLLFNCEQSLCRVLGDSVIYERTVQSKQHSSTFCGDIFKKCASILRTPRVRQFLINYTSNAHMCRVWDNGIVLFLKSYLNSKCKLSKSAELF